MITLDLPGFGESAPVGEGFDLDEVTDRIARALAAHRVPAPFDLVGHSLGGAVALTLAAHRPNLVRRLVLVAPGGLQRRRPPIPGALLGQSATGLFAARRRLVALSDRPWGRRLLLAFAAAVPEQRVVQHPEQAFDACVSGCSRSRPTAPAHCACPMDVA